MADIALTSHDLPDADELVDLYGSVGWTAYTSDPALLHNAVARSLRVISARDDGRLVGLARVVGDGLTIVYLQDILVKPSHQNSGIGKQLFDQVFEPFGNVRQKVLITDDEPRQQSFYRHMGFTEIRDMHSPIRAFVRFN
ncbi:MAG: GNAT family N-acetyltransferase [Arachnia sp.]